MKRRNGILWVCMVAALGLSVGATASCQREAEPARGGAAVPADRKLTTSPATGPVVGVWRPPAGLTQVPLWPGSPPNAADVVGPAEHSETSTNPKRFAGLPVTGVFDVSTPTMTVYPAKGVASGAAVLVFPGGGFQLLAIDLEGSEACDWMTARGVVCILVKYRVPNSNHHYDRDCHCAVTPTHLTALQDAQRAIRLVRSQAQTLHIDPEKIGVIGFSAGGYLVAQTSNIVEPAYTPVDEIDRISSRPNFAMALYPGHLCRAGGALDTGIHVTRETPPTFLVAASDDPTDPVCNSRVYARALHEAGVSTELHLFAQGGHAFGLRPTGHSVDRWTSLMEGWLKDIAIL
jgi:acetyl esterase/lipase